MNRPNPEVYRLAAERIDADLNNYSCNAIDSVCRHLGLKSWKYVDQYAQMFGPPPGTSDLIHPFWNAGMFVGDRRNPKVTRRCRINALLLMADICENPAN